MPACMHHGTTKSIVATLVGDRICTTEGNSHRGRNTKMGNFEMNAVELPAVHVADYSGTTHVALLTQFSRVNSKHSKALTFQRRSRLCESCTQILHLFSSGLQCHHLEIALHGYCPDFPQCIASAECSPTLIYLGRFLRNRVLWYFETPDGVDVEVSSKALWADITHADNAVMHLETDATIPPAGTTSHMHSHAHLPHELLISNVQNAPLEQAHRCFGFGHVCRHAAE
jgi:hypothetical protein